MQLSTKGRYAVMAMADIANQSLNVAAKPIALAEIAERQGISLSYLEQLFVKLRRAGLVESVRGPGGGYKLSRDPSEILIANIMGAVDEPIKMTRCVPEDNPLGCVSGKRCLTHGLWSSLGQNIVSFLSDITLYDVVSGALDVTHEPVEAKKGEVLS